MDKLDEALGSSREKTSPRKRIRVDPKKASISKLAPDQSTSSSSSVYTQPPPASVACARTEEPSERIQDPFLCSLRCKNDPDSRHHQVLWWHSPVPPIPLAVEMGLIGVLVPYQKREHGLFRDQPTHRIRQLQRLCESKDIALSTALSLRRHHMKRWNPNLGMSQLRLGSDDDIRESARLFEEAVHDYLRRSNVAFYAESEQKAHIRKHRQSGQPYPPTPDFILKEPIRIKTYVRGQGNDRRVIQERSICWIEVKMFYGASTIEHDGRSAVGCLRNTAQKYIRVHGEGAMIFMHGYGDRLASELAEVGVVALDCSCRDSVSLERVEAHQRTWCGDRNGNILP